MKIFKNWVLLNNIMLKSTMLMKTNIFFSTFLQGTDIFVQGNISDVIIFVTMDEMRKFIIVLNIISRGKPCHLKIKHFYRDLQNYCICFCKQGEFLYDPREVISEFLMFEQNFVPTPNLEKVVFKGSLTIINRQPPPSVGLLRLPIQELGLRISIKQFILMVLSSLVSQMA